MNKILELLGLNLDASPEDIERIFTFLKSVLKEEVYDKIIEDYFRQVSVECALKAYAAVEHREAYSES